MDLAQRTRSFGPARNERLRHQPMMASATERASQASTHDGPGHGMGRLKHISLSKHPPIQAQQRFKGAHSRA